MKTRSGPPTLRDSYFALVKKFPLVPIRDDDHLAKASAMIDSLLRRDLDEAESAYLDVLSDLVERFEDVHHRMPNISQGAMLRFLLEQNEVSQSLVARATGIQPSIISEVLSETRELSKSNIQSLARYFKVSPGVFFDCE